MLGWDSKFTACHFLLFIMPSAARDTLYFAALVKHVHRGAWDILIDSWNRLLFSSPKLYTNFEFLVGISGRCPGSYSVLPIDLFFRLSESIVLRLPIWLFLRVACRRGSFLLYISFQERHVWHLYLSVEFLEGFYNVPPRRLFQWFVSCAWHTLIAFSLDAQLQRSIPCR